MRFDLLPEPVAGIGAASMVIGAGALVRAYVVHGVKTSAGVIGPRRIPYRAAHGASRSGHARWRLAQTSSGAA